METPKVVESEYRFCLILWEYEPIKSEELVRLCQEQLGWKSTTTYTVIKRLSERGVLKNENNIVTSLVSQDQVKSILLYKKPGFWILAAAIVLCVAVAVCFLTNPAAKNEGLYEDAVLCVGIRDSNGSVLEENTKWHYYDIRRDERVTLPGDTAVELRIEALAEDAIQLAFSTSLLDGNGEVQQLSLPRGEMVTLYAGDPGGSTEYSFLIMAQPSASDQAYQWIGDAYDFWEEQTVMFPYFPGVTFHYNRSSLWAENSDQERLDIAEGMPIQNVYFADLSGDGSPEICASVSFGSGIIDTYVMVADYVTGERFFLRDRGVCDYTLTLDGSKLVCVVTDYHDGVERKRGQLTLTDAGGGSGRTLVLIEEDSKSEPTVGTRDMSLSDLSVLAQKGMDLACEDIMLSWGEAYIIDTSQRLTGRDWFDAYRSPAESLLLRDSPSL